MNQYTKRLKNAHLFYNLSEAELIEHSLKKGASNKLSSKGALVFTTGKFTGRASNDKYVVEEDYSSNVIDWSNNIKKMAPNDFLKIKEELLDNFNDKKYQVYFTSTSVCADKDYSLGVELITSSPTHALFSKTIFRESVEDPALGKFTIYHDQDFLLDPNKYSLASSTVIAINFQAKEIIIVGTGYAGEIKKSIFSVLNTLLPDLGVLPMHTGANLTKEGYSSLFFGLSGTGKTTLSTDLDVDIIGDDEHGLSESGIFNFEGGCYAKTNGLSKDKEIDIFQAANQFKSLLENVSLDSITREPNYNDTSLTENGRATYSLKTLGHIVENSIGPIPKNVFFLSADAMGVLPAISLLTNDQAIYYFLSGYTAKLAGTEIGLKGVTATFSHCFGAPFMMRHPKVYSQLLKNFLNKHNIKVWLVNTGWFGGVYGEGKRYPLHFTRNCIRAIQKNPENIEFDINEVFSLKIPRGLENVDSQYLDPKNLWVDKSSYDKAAIELKKLFEENIKKYNF
ncbi:MAG: phosphoenolpyruvate carboxykinase (ATP) [Bdellovibrionales bacterium]|nr:phosphoenolpyruvate carboxykinase (ATP) [Bdellovibrionales bacterium]